MLALVGLREVAARPAGTSAPGMRQRLELAGALLGDPAVIVLDGPVNGLDPEGIHWIASCCVGWPPRVAPVVASSHLMSEMTLTADQLVIIGRGRLLAESHGRR